MLDVAYDGITEDKLIRRYALGLVPVCNRFGSGAQTIWKVKDFHIYLQDHVKRLVERHGVEDQASSYSPRS